MRQLDINISFMQRYRITTPLVAIRLYPSPEVEKAGVMSSLPYDAVVETQGPSRFGNSMIEVTWEHQRYAVFELDLATRAASINEQSVGAD